MSVATKPSARTISTTLQTARQRDADLRDPRVAGTGGGVDRLAQLDLAANGIADSGSSAPYIARLVRGGGGGGARPGRIEQLERLRGAVDRGRADLVGVGEGGGLAGDAAQAEARAGVEVGGLQPSVVEPERFGHAILEVELAIVMARRGGGRRGAGLVGIELAAVEEVARIGAHAPDWAGGVVGRAAFEHEAAVAIAAVDEADCHRCADRRADGRARRRLARSRRRRRAGLVMRMVSGGGRHGLSPSNGAPALQSRAGVNRRVMTRLLVIGSRA